MAVINDIRDFSKLEAGRVTLEKRPTHIRNLIQDILSFYMTEASTKGIILHAGIDHDIPDWILLDGIRVKQILTHLIGNSIKFTTEGGEVDRCLEA